jgi:hypothetical protein
VSCHSAVSQGGTDLWAADLATMSVFTVTLDPRGHVTAALTDGRLVWSLQQDDGYATLALRWREALPGARQADPH